MAGEDLEIWSSKEFAANPSAATFRSQISGYYRTYWGTDITVTLEMYDANSVVTDNASSASSYVYTVKLLKTIDGISTKAVTGVAVTSEASFAAVPPMQSVTSTPPIKGQFSVTCTDASGIDHTSTPMDFDNNAVHIEYYISQSVPFLADRIKVHYDWAYSYADNGISFLLEFVGVNHDVPLCRIHGEGDDPITGNSPVDNSTVLRNFGETLMFEPVPLEFLRAQTTVPQLLVSIDGLQALCSNLTCDYKYTTPEMYTDAQKLSDSGLLTVTGSAFESIQNM